jgi:septum formation protein
VTALVLASRSAARRAMLAAAGVPFEALDAGVDEESAKEALRADGLHARQLADALAELKAIKLSRSLGPAIVLGCDSTVEAADGTMLDKAGSRDEARAQLRALAGTTHRLTSAVVAAQHGQPIWRHVETARLTMRDFSDAFLEAYLDAEWPAIGGCVGGYRLEARGVQLFARIEGSHFTIQGLPLLPLLAWLRDRGVMAR